MRIAKRFPINDGEYAINVVRGSELSELYDAATHSRRELIQWMNWSERFSLSLAGKYVAKRRRAWLSMERNFDVLGFTIRCRGEFVGVIDLGNFCAHEKSAEISYWADSRRTGRGIARHALHMLVTMCFELGIQRVMASIHGKNKASQHVIRHLGGIRIGSSTSIQSRSQGWFDQFKITPATFVNRNELNSPFPERLHHPNYVDLAPERTGLDGILRIRIPGYDPPCVHYMNGADDYCIPVRLKSQKFSRMSNAAQPDRSITKAVRAWIKLNRKMVMSYAKDGDLWKPGERDQYLAGLVSIQN